MELSPARFKTQAAASLADARLQSALEKLQDRFVVGRAQALLELDNADAVRDAAADIRARTLANLDDYLERFEAAARAAGAEVHWAENASDVNRILVEIAARHGVKRVVKSKSMVTEECRVNEALGTAGLEVRETDLGEYILQLADEPPSHIVAPVVHKSRDEIADLFVEHHRTPRRETIPALVAEARERLRPAFLAADMGISGANFLVAETGSALIVTNEGNGRLATTLPRVHVAVTGIEKVVPTLEDVATLLRLLPRYATGQSITNYVSILTGPRRPDDGDGPEHFHVILVDNGRSRMLGTDRHDMLRCIRCGACMNHCPVYQNVGGHAYGWVYPGPMGSVLTPALLGPAEARDLPNASTLCGACAQVCPVKIPLPDLLRNLREEQVEQRLRPAGERLAIRLWGLLARHPFLYGVASGVIARALRLYAGRDGAIRRLPLGRGWTLGRDFPAPSGRTFRELYVRRGRA
ncbi:(Fe-S)-binding protein [Sulfurifustis variabilis]|uniref:(Fe-S)-binding protein n=1 Tax=Sulfurifustis variabilis TaxID=1675686 RepID=A0A1B4VBQ4_9GAMM|nr:LutB/LldF family L-lactate oxidation iron-sulfur protein [Sulfurifustis variabilis]BAU49934.1 (Fe-S)-binding protein [Sulfurifustis variabilis]